MPSHTVGEHMVYDLADFSMDLYIKKNADKIVIAACTEGKWQGNHYHYEHKKARNFTWSASTFYRTVWGRAGKTTILGYVYYNHVNSGQKAAQVVHDALVLFEELFGEYPHNHLVFVEADFQDGMEYDGLFFLDQYYFANPGSDARASLTTLSVHETAHQWWLNMVSNNQAREPWLDEALSTYSELFFYERYYPAFTSWWWDYRVKHLHT
jgi:aminopeptidase N